MSRGLQGQLSRQAYNHRALLVKKKKADWYRRYYSPEGAVKAAKL